MRREPRGREVQRRPEGHPPGLQSALADRRRRRPEGIARARRRHREGRRPEASCSSAARRACSTARRTASRPSSARQYKEGDVIVIRYEGPKGGPGMREMLSTTAALYGQGAGEKVALITDGRFSGAHARLLHRPCRAGGGGRRPDRPAEGRRHHLHRRRQGHDRRGSRRRRAGGERRKSLEAPPNPYQSGALRKYADQVGPARNGAVTHAGGKAEVVCYADI